MADCGASPVSPDFVSRVKSELNPFYKQNPQVKASHGLAHSLAVYNHAVCAVESSSPPLDSTTVAEILIASLLHDVDDKKYFPDQEESEYRNAKKILSTCCIPAQSCEKILWMISIVSCSANGNSVPESIKKSGQYYYLIPRWSDRLEAVGKIGVVRCYQYNLEKGQPLSSEESPRPTTIEEVWSCASPERFEAYQKRGGTSADMISHYFDKLLHVAAPPKDIVRNQYLEEKGQESSHELIEVCLRYGKTGLVDEVYLKELVQVCQR